MAKLKLFFIITQLINLSSSMIINMCDCNNLKNVGTMDTETPAYCRKEKTEDTFLADYRFFVNEEPHMSWEG